MTIISLQPFLLTRARRLLFLLIAKALILMAVILYAGIELGPDEAQYWTWSQALNWGYYSKPLGIAWQIWLGTQLFGQTEWGVRSVTLILAFFQAWAIYQLALQAGLFPRTAFWCGLFMAFSPLGMLGSLFAITDVGFLLCWTGACCSVVSALHQKQEPNPCLIGVWVMAGALFKWPIYFFWLFFCFCRHWYFPHQKKAYVLAGILLSLLGLLPSIWWNWSHDWATFRHVFATLQGGSEHRSTGNIEEFLGSQVMLLSPILFILLVFGLWQWLCQKKSLTPALFFCGFVTLVSLSCAIFVSCFQKIQGNWITFAYPTGLIILGWDSFQEHPIRAWWAKMGLWLSVILTSLFFLLPAFYNLPSLQPYAPSYRFNPFKHNIGWAMLQRVLASHGYDPNKHFLVSDKYQTTSILSFYGEGQHRAYFLNLEGGRNNQFSYWPSLQEEQQEKTGYFVWIENMPYLERQWQAKLNFYQSELQRYFEKVEFLELAPLVYEGSSIVKGALIFRCHRCKDCRPVHSQLY
jgi:4-amino-4-deoxy-L-arabinose transferase-like glycosyltransferase